MELSKQIVFHIPQMDADNRTQEKSVFTVPRIGRICVFTLHVLSSLLINKAAIVFPILQARWVMEDLANGRAQGKGSRTWIPGRFPTSSLFSIQVLFSPHAPPPTPHLFPFTEGINSGYDIVSTKQLGTAWIKSHQCGSPGDPASAAFLIAKYWALNTFFLRKNLSLISTEIRDSLPVQAHSKFIYPAY